MKKRLLAVLDLEESYTTHIIDYINCKMNGFFITKGFTNINNLLEYCKTTVIDILLISDQEADGVTNEPNISNIVLLNTGNEINLNKNYPIVNKFQSADKLIKEVLEYTIDSPYSEVICSKNSNIIGVYSPINGCGKTSLALSLAHVFSKNIPTLYINTEEFSGLSTLLSKEFSSDLSDLFYFYKQSPNKLQAKIFTTIQSLYDLDFIPPLSYSYDLRNIEAGEWKDLIYRIIEVSDYEMVIIDLSNMVKDIFCLLEWCTIVYMPIKNDSISHAKVIEFEEFMKQVNKSEILDRIIKVELPLDYLNQPSVDYIDHVFLSPFINYVRNLIKESNIKI